MYVLFSNISIVANYVLASLILSAINVVIACLLCWMVHGNYQVPKFIKNYIFRYLGKLRLPPKKSHENKIIEQAIEQLHKHFLNKHAILHTEHPSEGASNEFVELGRIEEEEAADNTENIYQRNEAHADSGPQANYQDANKNKKFWLEVLKEMYFLKEEIYYFILLKMKENTDPHLLAQEELKELAVIMNRVSGIMLILINGLLLLYTALVVLTEYDGINWNV